MTRRSKPLRTHSHRGSWLTFDNISRAAVASLIIHFVIVLFIVSVCASSFSPYLAILIGVDLILWTVNLLPLVAAWRREIAWHDPIVAFFGLIVMMTATIVPAYALNPQYAQLWASFDADVFTSMSQPAFLVRLCEAEMVVIIFSTILILTNQQILQGSDSAPFVQQEAQCINFIASLLSLTALCCFIYLWNVGNFSSRFSSQLGALDESINGQGRGRYWLLMYAGCTAVPLMLASSRTIRFSKRPVLLFLMVGPAVVLTALPNLMSGSRISVVFAIAGSLIILRHLGVRFSRRAWCFAAMLIVLLITLITLARQNQSGEDSLLNLIRSSREALLGGQLEARMDSVSFLYDVDRIGIIAMVQEFLRNGETFLHGSSLVAGLVNTIVDYYSKIVGGVGFSSNNLLATSEIRIWRYGVDLGNAAPPSYPGEFYMQYGYSSLVLLSIMLGLLFRRLRECLFRSRTMLRRFAWCSVCLTVVFNVTVEVGPVFAAFITNVLPVIVTCWLGTLSISVEPRERDVERPRADRLKDGAKGA